MKNKNSRELVKKRWEAEDAMIVEAIKESMTDDDKVNAAMERYAKKFNGAGLPIDFETHYLKNSDDADEWVAAIDKAIQDGKPFEDEGVEF